MRAFNTAFAGAASLFVIASGGGAAEGQEALRVVGDAMPQSLTGRPGDPVRGREIAFSRDRGNCPICHVLPAEDDALHGNLGPSLKGVARRLSEGQMRLRLVDSRRLNPQSIMPPYYSLDGLKHVQAAYAGKTVLTRQEIEDVLGYLLTLRSDDK